LTEGWPDFWIRGKKIDLIDLVDTINLIKQINTISTVNNLGTLDTLKTIETVQKINPQTINGTEYNTVLDLIKTIQQIDNITSLGTLDTINTVDKIQKINPQNTDNVVIDRLKLINLIETINTLETLNTINTVDTINMIDKIKVIHDARIVPNFIQNGSFRTGDFTGWIGRSANAYVEYDSDYRDYVCVLPGQYDYVGQLLPPLYGEESRIKVRYRHEVDGAKIRIQLLYVGAASEDYDFTATSGGVWYDAIVEPTTKHPLAAIVIWNLTDGSELRITGCEMLRKQLVYQAEKDRTISREGAVVHFSKSFSASGSSDIALPASGKALRVLAWNLYCDADVVCELRFKNSGNVIAGLPAKGATAMNLIGCTAPTGDTDEPIEIYVGGAANVKGWVCVEEA